MCRCRPEVRTPCCGSLACGHPDNCFHTEPPLATETVKPGCEHDKGTEWVQVDGGNDDFYGKQDYPNCPFCKCVHDKGNYWLPLKTDPYPCLCAPKFQFPVCIYCKPSTSLEIAKELMPKHPDMWCHCEEMNEVAKGSKCDYCVSVEAIAEALDNQKIYFYQGSELEAQQLNKMHAEIDRLEEQKALLEQENEFLLEGNTKMMNKIVDLERKLKDGK